MNLIRDCSCHVYCGRASTNRVRKPPISKVKRSAAKTPKHWGGGRPTKTILEYITAPRWPAGEEIIGGSHKRRRRWEYCGFCVVGHLSSVIHEVVSTTLL